VIFCKKKAFRDKVDNKAFPKIVIFFGNEINDNFQILESAY